MNGGMEQVLRAHTLKYPEMRPCDAVKLLFQSEFGGGHLISDCADCLAALKAEYTEVTADPSYPLLEEIGGGMVRVMLAALEEGRYPLEELNEDFVRSANGHIGSMEQFYKKLDLLRGLTRGGEMPFSLEELEGYLIGYLAAGCPPVSHSSEYRAAYHPAYRVVERRRALGLAAAGVRRLLARQGRVLIALDGRCAAGKTTLAGDLSDRYGWSVVHMDHFFLRPEQQTPERRQTPGENVDHERFLEQVLLPLRAGQAPVYRPYDCHTRSMAEPVQVTPAPVTLVEGSYSCHPTLRELYDLRLFLDVEPEEQLRRIALRNGPDSLETFRTMWIPLEEQYFAACQVRETCHLMLEL